MALDSETQTSSVPAGVDEALATDQSDRIGWWQEVREYGHALRSFSVPARWYLSGGFFVGVSTSVYMLLFNLHLQEMGISETLMGTILSGQSLGGVLLTLPAAAVVTRVSIRWLLPVAATLFGGLYATMTLVSVPTVIIAAATLSGAVIAFVRVCGSPFLMKYTSRRERSLVFSSNFAVMLGAGLLANFAAGYAHDALIGVAGSSESSYRIVLLVGAGMSLVAAFCYSRIPSGPAGERGTRGPLRDFWRRKGRLIFRLTFPFFIVGMGAGLVIPFLNLYFANRFNLSAKTVGVYYALVQLLMVVGVMGGPVLARRYGMIRTVVYTEWASLPFMIVLAYTDNLPLATVAFLARGALMNMGVPVANNYTMERVGESDRALANSASMLAWASSWTVTAVVGGAVIEHFGFTPVLVVSCVLYAISSAMYFLMFRKEELFAGKEFSVAPRRGDP